jgi:hypothetical protein
MEVDILKKLIVIDMKEKENTITCEVHVCKEY